MSSPAFRSAHIHRHRTVINAVFVAVMQSLTIFPTFVIVTSTSKSWWDVGLFIIATTALYFRYSKAQLTLITVALSMALSTLLAYPFVTAWWSVPVMVYHYARHGHIKQRRLILVGAICASFVGGHTLSKVLSSSSWSLIPHPLFAVLAIFVCLTLVTIPWLVGNTLRLSEIRQIQLEERTRQLEYEQEQERQLAAQDERAHIAREMHDIVAHSLSSIITQADGARYAAQAQEARPFMASTEARNSVPPASEISLELRTLETISSAARESLGQMRQLLGILRTTEDTVLEPLPALRNIPQLVEQMRVAGFNVTFGDTVSGSEIAEHLPTGAELVAYRVIQESLTNITKHAASSERVEVLLSVHQGLLKIYVENSAPIRPTESIPGSRRGLLGMRERINLYQGTLHYGELEDGGFTVIATIPTIIQ